MIDPLGPEFQDILSRVQRAKEYVKDWRANMRRWRLLYDMKHYSTKARDGEVQYSDPTYTNTVDLSVGIMLGNKLRWHAFGFSPSHAEQKGTTQVEKLLDGTLMINDEREETNQLYQLYLYFCRDGGAAIYSVFDPVLADEAEIEIEIPDEEQGSIPVSAFMENPLRAQVIDPDSLILLPGGPKRWLAIGRTESRSVLDMETLYDVQLPDFIGSTQDQKATTFGEFIDFWDYNYADVQLIDSQGVEVFNNVLGRPETEKRLMVRNTVMFMDKPILGPRSMEGYVDLPYTVQFFKPTGTDPSEWHSILKPLESSVSLLERTFNRRAHQIDVFTSLPIVSKVQFGRAVKVDPGLYNHVQLQPDESLEFPIWQGNAPDLNFHIEFLRSRIQQSGYSDVMFGSGQSQIAGYALSQLGDQNRIRLEQPISHLELMLTHWAKKSLRLLGEFAEGMYIRIYGRHKGQDYFEYVPVDNVVEYSVRAEIRPSYPNEETRKTAMATQVKGTLSEYTIMERYLGIEQPDQEEERKMIEAASRHPAVIQYGIISELKKRVANGDEIAQVVLNQLMSGSLPGTPGRPNEPNNPEQLTGLQSPTGQATPQAEGKPPPGQSEEDAINRIANAAPGMMSGVVQ